jgi:hypothetical protein
MVLAIAFGGFCLCFMTSAAPVGRVSSGWSDAAVGLVATSARASARNRNVRRSGARDDCALVSSPILYRLHKFQ